jgi:hypothetical protein
MTETRSVRCACGNQFEIVSGKRGRPPSRCVDCQAAKTNGTLRERLAQLAPSWISQELGVSPDELVEQSKAAQTKKQDEIAKSKAEAEARIDRLDMMLKSTNSHISQHLQD